MDKNKGSLKRVLNVIYFIDSNKTRTFRLSLGRALTLLIALVLMFIWSIASVIILCSYSRYTTAQEERIRESLATIFEYQSRYDAVYESTYIDNGLSKREVKPADNKEQQIAINNTKPQELKKTEATQPNKEIQAEAQKETAKVEQEEVAYSKANIDKESDSEGSIVTIEEAKTSLSETDQKLGVMFNIKNLQTPEKVEGYVWGVAEFLTDKGNTIYVGTPTGISVDQNGVVNRPKASIRYNIRYYKQTSLQFAKPNNVKGEFKNIKISLMDQHEKVEVFNIPLTKDNQTGYKINKKTKFQTVKKPQKKMKTARKPIGIRYAN